MSHKSKEPATVVVEGIPITPKLVEVLQSLIDSDPCDSKDVLATGNMFIQCIESEDLEQMDKHYFGLQLQFFELLVALENKVDTHAKLE